MPLAQASIKEKAGTLPAVAFSGNPKEAAVAFASPYPSADYSVLVDIEVSGQRSFAHAIKNRTASGFTISLCADNISGLVGVSWVAALPGET